MPQSFSAVHLHLIFSTKNRSPFLHAALAPQVHDYLGGILRHHGCPSILIGGIEDHVHALFSFNRTMPIADLVRTLKAGSSRWIHETFPQERAFAWQSGYAVFSVSASGLERVRTYIANQAKHHKTVTFQDEYREFLQKHGIEWDERYVWD